MTYGRQPLRILRLRIKISLQKPPASPSLSDQDQSLGLGTAYARPLLPPSQPPREKARWRRKEEHEAEGCCVWW